MCPRHCDSSGWRETALGRATRILYERDHPEQPWDEQSDFGMPPYCDLAVAVLRAAEGEPHQPRRPLADAAVQVLAEGGHAATHYQDVMAALALRGVAPSEATLLKAMARDPRIVSVKPRSGYFALAGEDDGRPLARAEARITELEQGLGRLLAECEDITSSVPLNWVEIVAEARSLLDGRGDS